MAFAEHVLAYVAGVVDGEGSVTLSKNKPSENRRPRLSVPSTTFSLINWMWITFGGTITGKRRQKSHHSKSWVWHLDGDKSMDLMKSIVPYMRVPEKIDRIKLLLAEYKKTTVRNGKYTVVQRQRKLNFEKRFLELRK